jgi:hypothetical protein
VVAVVVIVATSAEQLAEAVRGPEVTVITPTFVPTEE